MIQNNIANAATPGYARQRAALAPVVLPGGGAPRGVELQGVQSLRDNLLEFQVFSSRQTLAQISQEVRFFDLVEPNFRLDSAGGIDSAVDSFFASAAELSINPTDPNLRASLLSSAGAAAGSFRSVYNDLQQQSTNLDSEARATVKRINELADQVGELQSARGSTDPKQPNFAVETRLNQVLDELSGLTEFTLQRQQDGALSVIAGGVALVTGANVRHLSVSTSQNSLSVFDASGNNATASFSGQGGRLGGLLEERNDQLPELLGNVNRLAKSFADQVNEQLSRGVDLNGSPGQPLFDYVSSAFTGSGRAAGAVGAATAAPPVSVDVTFSGSLSGSISATIDGFFVASAAPAGAAAGDTLSVRFVKADGAVDRTITTSPLLGGETASDLATRLNDQISIDPDLAGLISFSDEGGNLKTVLSDQAGQGFTFTSSTSNAGFISGLEAGGTLGGQSAEEIAAALNAEVALDPSLTAAGVRFVAIQGEVRFDGDTPFDFTVTDNDPAGTGFASGLDGAASSAGGALAAPALRLANISPAEIAAGFAGAPNGNENILAVASLVDTAVLDTQTFNEYYAGIVRDVGAASAGASSRLETQQQITITAENLRDNLSGVDINEEAVQLLQYEQGFSAMLRVIQVLDGLSNDILSLVR